MRWHRGHVFLNAQSFLVIPVVQNKWCGCWTTKKETMLQQNEKACKSRFQQITEELTNFRKDSKEWHWNLIWLTINPFQEIILFLVGSIVSCFFTFLMIAVDLFAFLLGHSDGSYSVVWGFGMVCVRLESTICLMDLANAKMEHAMPISSRLKL